MGFEPDAIFLGAHQVGGGTFADADIKDMATLKVVGRRVATAAEVVDRFVELNPGVSREQLTKGLKLKDDRVTVKSWSLYNKGLMEVPEELCDLKITGHLHISSNKIVSTHRGNADWYPRPQLQPDHHAAPEHGGNANWQ